MKINEVFETIQGEAAYTGTPSLFVRTQVCPVGCPWCDTKHTWEAPKDTETHWLNVVAKTGDSPMWGTVSPAELLDWASVATTVRHLVLTGGEPMLDPDTPEMCGEALNRGWTVQIETSGTASNALPNGVWVTLSPKVDMPGGLNVSAAMLGRANEIKMPVGSPKDIERLDDLISRYAIRDKPIWLQPLSQSKKATRLAMQVAIKRNWKLSIQTHKCLGVR